jgi:hypothetical protein
VVQLRVLRSKCSGDILGEVRMAERPIDNFPTPKVRFLGEHDGAPEREFKSRIMGVLRSSSTAEAYLADVSYEGARSPVLAVCLVGDAGEADKVCGEIAGIFTRMFRDAMPFDMMYITRDQRLELARVCRPFYLKPTMAQA